MPLFPCICLNAFSSKRSIFMELVTDTPLQTTAPLSLQFPTNKNANMAGQLMGSTVCTSATWTSLILQNKNSLEKYAPFCVKWKLKTRRLLKLGLLLFHSANLWAVIDIQTDELSTYLRILCYTGYSVHAQQAKEQQGKTTFRFLQSKSLFRRNYLKKRGTISKTFVQKP
jgi:hypothetical protein